MERHQAKITCFRSKQFTAILITVVAFVSPYMVRWGGAWWKFFPASATIIFIWRWTKPETYIANLGLKFDRGSLGIAAIALILVATAAAYIIPSIVVPLGYVYGPTSDNLGWRSLSIFQVLNEEMLFRAMLLTELVKRFRSRWSASIAAAAIFATLHYAFYRYGIEKIPLQWEALATLILFALVCNSLFMISGNIAIPYAIHVGWNFTRFGSDWVVGKSGHYLGEAAGFNLIEGNDTVLAFAIGLVVLSLLFDAFRQRFF